jgi:hypothetical protein
MGEDIEMKFFLGPNTFLFPEASTTETMYLNMFKKFCFSTNGRRGRRNPMK